MPGTTTNLKLPYPLGTEKANLGAEDIKLLAEALDALGPGWVPVGTVSQYVGAGDPSTTWLICDGRELSRTAYAALFAALGTAYGEGNKTTTFNIPDLRGRVAIRCRHRLWVDREEQGCKDW